MSNPYRWHLKAPSGPLDQCAVQDVPRSVVIPTQTETTRVAVMPPLGQSLGDRRAAGRTRLRRTGWVHRDQQPTSDRSFVEQDAQEFAPASIVNGLGQHRASQRLRVQVFDADQSVVLDQGMCRFVMEIASLVGNAGVQSSDFLACLLPSSAAALATGQLPLC